MDENPTIRPSDHWKIRSKDDLRVADDTSRDDLDDARSWFIGGSIFQNSQFAKA